MATRTARKHTIETRDKTAIRLQKEYSVLIQKKYRLPKIELEKPIRSGFKKFYVLRDDIANRQDAGVFKSILKVINDTIYCKNEEFKAKKYYSKQLENLPHDLKFIGVKEWIDKKYPESWKKYFDLKTKVVRSRHGQYSFTGYFFRYEWYFVPKIEPHFITHLPQLDPELEAKLEEIRNTMDQKGYWRRLDHLRGSNKWKQYRDGHTPQELTAQAMLEAQLFDFEYE
jgi:hypothetical protein